MFTGIVEEVGELVKKKTDQKNVDFFIRSELSKTVKIDQSISHNGVCLTVVGVKDDVYKVTAIEETLVKSNLGLLSKGDKVNLERCLKLGDRIDGHLVQGHVDTTVKCLNIDQKKGSWVFSFSYSKKYAPLLIDKGSICVNGVSLTIMKLKKKSFSVAIIPYTFEHTNFFDLEVGDAVNIEFDILGKYIFRKLSI